MMATKQRRRLDRAHDRIVQRVMAARLRVDPGDFVLATAVGSFGLTRARAVGLAGERVVRDLEAELARAPRGFCLLVLAEDGPRWQLRPEVLLLTDAVRVEGAA